MTLTTVRVAMKRMADDDELLRPDPDAVLYGLASTEGTEEALGMSRPCANAGRGPNGHDGNGQPG